MYQPINGSTVEIWSGFSWPCFFFGALWYASKGLWLWAVIAFIVSIPTFGLSMFVFPFFANGQHVKYLESKGYLSNAQWDSASPS